MQTKQEILDKYVPCQCWPANDGGRLIYNSSCPQHSQDPEMAMDEWAEIESVSFMTWMWNNVDSHGGYPGDERFITYNGNALTAKDLYQLYKKETQQTK